jgi:hypothetical protein
LVCLKVRHVVNITRTPWTVTPSNHPGTDSREDPPHQKPSEITVDRAYKALHRRRHGVVHPFFFFPLLTSSPRTTSMFLVLRTRFTTSARGDRHFTLCIAPINPSTNRDYLCLGSRYFECRKENNVFILKSFFFSLSDVGENGDVNFIRRGIENRKNTLYVVSINSSIKNHFYLLVSLHLSLTLIYVCDM